MLLWFLGYVVWSQLQILIAFIRQRKRSPSFGRRKVTPPNKPFCRFPKKPDWVPKEIIRRELVYVPMFTDDPDLLRESMARGSSPHKSENGEDSREEDDKANSTKDA